MRNFLFKKSLLPVVLFFICFETLDASSATAVATATATIVPHSEFAISDVIKLGLKPDMDNDKEYSTINRSGAVMSSLNANNMAKIKINSSHNRIYNISVLPHQDITNDSNKIKFKNMKVANELELLNSKGEQELILEGTIIKPNIKYKSSYFDTVDITMNYN